MRMSFLVPRFYDGLPFRLGIAERKQDAAYFSSFLDDEDEEFFGDYDTLEESSQQLDDNEGGYQSRKLLSVAEQGHCGQDFEDNNEGACATAEFEEEYEAEDESEMAPRCKELVLKAEALWKKLNKEGLEDQTQEGGMGLNERLDKVGSLVSGVEESRALLEEYKVRLTNNFDKDLKSTNVQGVKDSLMDGVDHRVCQPLLKRTIKAIKGITKGAMWVHQLSSLLKVIQCSCILFV